MTLNVNGATHRQYVTVREDPRIDLPIEQRRRWTDQLLEIGDLYGALVAENEVIAPVNWRIEHYRNTDIAFDEQAATEIEETHRLYNELLNRVSSLYFQVSSWPGPMTADQETQWAYYQQMNGRLSPRKEALFATHLPQLNRWLAKEHRIEAGPAR